MAVYMAGPFVVCCLLASFHGCYMEFREALWEKTGVTDSKHNNDNAGSCAADHMGTEHVAVRVKSDGRTTTCESLPLDWMTNKIISPGYLYLYKISNKIIMDPPTRINQWWKEHLTFILPGIFSEGSSVTVAFTGKYAYFSLSNADGNGESAWTDAALILVVVVGRGDAMNDVDMKYIKNKKMFDNEVLRSVHIPNCFKNICELSLFAGRNYIGINTQASRYNLTLKHQLPTTEMKQIRVIGTSDIRGYSQDIDLYSIEFKSA